MTGGYHVFGEIVGLSHFRISRIWTPKSARSVQCNPKTPLTFVVNPPQYRACMLNLSLGMFLPSHSILEPKLNGPLRSVCFVRLINVVSGLMEWPGFLVQLLECPISCHPQGLNNPCSVAIIIQEHTPGIGDSSPTHLIITF